MFQGELLTTLTVFPGYLCVTIAHNIDCTYVNYRVF